MIKRTIKNIKTNAVENSIDLSKWNSFLVETDGPVSDLKLKGSPLNELQTLVCCIENLCLNDGWKITCDDEHIYISQPATDIFGRFIGDVVFLKLNKQ